MTCGVPCIENGQKRDYLFTLMLTLIRRTPILRDVAPSTTATATTAGCAGINPSRLHSQQHFHMHHMHIHHMHMRSRGPITTITTITTFTHTTATAAAESESVTIGMPMCQHRIGVGVTITAIITTAEHRTGRDTMTQPHTRSCSHHLFMDKRWVMGRR